LTSQSDTFYVRIEFSFELTDSIKGVIQESILTPSLPFKNAPIGGKGFPKTAIYPIGPRTILPGNHRAMIQRYVEGDIEAKRKLIALI